MGYGISENSTQPPATSGREQHPAWWLQGRWGSQGFEVLLGGSMGITVTLCPHPFISSCGASKSTWTVSTCQMSDLDIYPSCIIATVPGWWIQYQDTQLCWDSGRFLSG